MKRWRATSCCSASPDCTVVVVDASALERNLYLVLQVLEITDRVVVAVNLIDEARRRGIEVDTRSLARRSRRAGRANRGADQREHHEAAAARRREWRPVKRQPSPAALEGHTRVRTCGQPAGAADRVVALRGARTRDGLRFACWTATPRSKRRWRAASSPSWWHASRRPICASAARSRCRGRNERARGDIPGGHRQGSRRAPALARNRLPRGSGHVALRARSSASRAGPSTARSARPLELDQRIDRIVTSRGFGLPLMLLMLAVVFWLTIVGANVPSADAGLGAVLRSRMAPPACSTSWGSPGGSPASCGTACFAAWRG